MTPRKLPLMFALWFAGFGAPVEPLKDNEKLMRELDAKDGHAFVRVLQSEFRYYRDTNGKYPFEEVCNALREPGPHLELACLISDGDEGLGRVLVLTEAVKKAGKK